PPIAPRKHKGTVPDGPLSSGAQVRSLPGPLSAANLPGLLVTESAFASWTVHGQSHPRDRPATTPRSGKRNAYTALRVARGGIEPSTPRFSAGASATRPDTRCHKVPNSRRSPDRRVTLRVPSVPQFMGQTWGSRPRGRRAHRRRGWWHGVAPM